MKNIFAFLFCLVFALNLFSAPVRNIPLTIKQPDGMALNVFISGDEFYHWLHDKDNYTIIKDSKTGYYMYATLLNDKIIPTNFIVGRVDPNYTGLIPGIILPDYELKKLRNDFYKDSPKVLGDAPTSGTINNLVVFVRFSDDPEFTDPLSYYKYMFNDDTTGRNSVYNYFKSASYNALSVLSTFYPLTSGTTVISYKDSHPRNYYLPYDSINNPNGYTDPDSREHALIKDAINYIASQVPANLNLDGDNDGKIDNIAFIIYGNASEWGTLLFPHLAFLYSYNVYINGKRVYEYNLQMENIVKSDGTSVLCHEMCHTLGIPDLYRFFDYNISPCYTWDLMAVSTKPPQQICAYLKWQYVRWITSIPILSTPGTYSLKPLTSPTNNCYRINSSYTSKEYYVVEFRRKAPPFEINLPGSGLLVYRIDSTQYGNGFGPPDEAYIYRPYGTLTQNGSPQSAYFSDLVGRTKIDKTTNPSPFLANGSQGGLNIYNITYHDTLISFTLGESTGIREKNNVVNEYELSQNYPNPFNPCTMINFRIKESGFVSLKVYDILGKEITTLVNEKLNPGMYEIPFSIYKLSVNQIPSGIYFYKLEVNKFIDVKKMILIK